MIFEVVERVSEKIGGFQFEKSENFSKKKFKIALKIKIQNFDKNSNFSIKVCFIFHFVLFHIKLYKNQKLALNTFKFSISQSFY
jgi:hypothetical protein